MIPASCQGIVAVESLKNRSELKSITSKINHPQTYLNGLIEREIALILEGGCKIPVGCYADVNNDKVNPEYNNKIYIDCIIVSDELKDIKLVKDFFKLSS